MPQNVSQLISLERSQYQKHFGISFIKIGTAVTSVVNRYAKGIRNDISYVNEFGKLIGNNYELPEIKTS